VRVRVPAWWLMGGLAVKGPTRELCRCRGRPGWVPEPDVQGNQVRVPEVEPGPGLGAAVGAQLLDAGEREGAVGVVAGGRMVGSVTSKPWMAGLRRCQPMSGIIWVMIW
jgi:hypothetical protein